MFLRSDHGLDEGGGAAALSFGRALAPIPDDRFIDTFRQRMAQIDWAPDLGARIGSAEWYRGAATCIALIATTCLLSPGLDRPLIGAAPVPQTGSAWDETRSQSIAPLAWGADTGSRLAANDLVRPLAESPERPIIQLTATVGDGDRFARVLERAGVAGEEAAHVADLVAGSMAGAGVRPGTPLELTLGRRANRSMPRPLEALRFRARFDLNLSVARSGGKLVLTPQPIAIDHSPLRIRGIVGSSLYRSARAAGAPAKAVENYIRVLATRIPVGGIGASSVFDLTIEQARAATGEVQLGQLLFAGLDQGNKKLQLFRWGSGQGQWYDQTGTGERKGSMVMPVAGHMTSTYGMRFHPIARIMRMHKGIDIGAPYGSPIRAAMDGIVAMAGRAGGYGNFVKLAHGGGIATGYGHMSRIAVRQGARVVQGQIIGYVGSTGLSTGPHLHWELWKNGAAVNPRSMSFSTVAKLSGEAYRAFRARVAALLSAKPASR